MRILALDPGSSKSALVLWDKEARTFESHYDTNEKVKTTLRYLLLLSQRMIDAFVIEYPRPRGQLASAHLFQTIYYAGCCAQVWEEYAATMVVGIKPAHRISRQDAAREITGNNATTARQLKQGIIEYFGGDDVAIGGVKCPQCKGKGWVGRGRPPCPQCSDPDTEAGVTGHDGWEIPPGPLYEFSKQGNGDHPWDALAVAIAYVEQADA